MIAQLPRALLVCFFLAAFTQSIPMVAFGIFLNEDIKMSFEEQARFYALTFIPWSLKPLYSLVMEYFGSGHRPKFVFVFSIGSALSLLLIAGFVRTVPEMYMATLLRSICEAVAEYGLSLTLIDVVVVAKRSNNNNNKNNTSEKPPAANGDKDFAAYAQSRATTARMMGSLIAFIFCLAFLYGCGGSSLPGEQSPRNVIAFSSLFAFGTAASACFLRVGGDDEDEDEPATADDDDGIQFGREDDGGGEEDEEEIGDTVRSRQEGLLSGNGNNQAAVEHKRTWRIYAGILYFQSFFVWIGVYSLVPLVGWLTIFLLYLTGFATIGVLAYKQQQRSSAAAPSTTTEKDAAHTNFSSGLFLFCLNASPTTSDVWFGFKMYALGNSSCAMQILLMLGELASVLACWFYPALLARMSSSTAEGQGTAAPKHRAFFFVVVFTVLASAVGMLTDFVLAARWKDLGNTKLDDGNLAIFAIVTLFVTFFGQLQFLSEQVFVTENCVNNNNSSSNESSSSKVLTPGMWYGIFLSLLEFGGSASGWIAAPIIGALHLDYASQTYANLWVLVLVSLLLPVGVMVVFAVYFRVTHNRAVMGGGGDGDNGEEEEEEAGVEEAAAAVAEDGYERESFHHAHLRA